MPLRRAARQPALALGRRAKCGPRVGFRPLPDYDAPMQERLQKDPVFAVRRGLETLQSLALAEPAVALEWDQSWAQFARSSQSYAEALRAGHAACGRFREWFLLERHSPTLMGAPLDRLIDPWRGSEEGFQEHVEPLLQASFTGIFEVGEVLADQGAWLRDVSGFGEYALADPESSRQIQPGDLLVGRLFPLPGSLHLASGQAIWLRNPALTQALERDLSKARQEQRNILHIDAPELEAMFFSTHWPNTASTAFNQAGHASETESAQARAQETDPQPADLAKKAVQAAHSFLSGVGWSAAQVEALFDRLRADPWSVDRITSTPGDPVGMALEQIAFESDADLTVARQTLTTAWQAFAVLADQGAGASASTPKPGSAKIRRQAPSAQEDSQPNLDPDSAEARRAALERFDAARASGGDLEAQLAALEQDLGLAPDPPEPDTEVAPDFPGVVAAMIEEWRWDRQRLGLPKLAGDLGPFEAYCEKIGRFEALNPREVLSFVCFWGLEKRVWSDARTAQDCMVALSAFCGWASEEHGLEFAGALESTLQGLTTHLPRAVELTNEWAHAGRAKDGDAHEPGQLLRVPDSGWERDWDDSKTRLHLPWLDRAGQTVTVELATELLEQLAPGDAMRARIGLGGQAEILCFYPPEARELQA